MYEYTFRNELDHGAFYAPFLLLRLRRYDGLTLIDCIGRFAYRADAEAARATLVESYNERFVVKRLSRT